MKSNLRQELIKFCDSIRDYEHESGHSIYQDDRESSEFVDIYLKDKSDREIIDSVFGSPPPTIEQTAIIYQEYKNGDFIDTLQEGDYVENLSEKQLEKLLDIEGDLDDVRFKWHEGIGLVFYGGILYTTDGETKKISTKLAPEEFLRRAENTFKK